MKRILEQVWNDIRHGENIDLYVTLVVAISLPVLSFSGTPQASTWITSLTPAVLALLAVSLLVNRRKMEASQQAMDSDRTRIEHLFSNLIDKLPLLTEIERTGFQRLYSDTRNQDFIEEIKRRLQTASVINISSIGISVLWDDDIFELLKRRVESRRIKVTILLADANSPQIKLRLTEEEEDPSLAPRGPEHMQRVLGKLQALEASIKDANVLDVRQFGHYPTFTLIIIDDTIFCYPYGYQKVGSAAPVLHLKDIDSKQARYYREQFARVLANCPPGDGSN